MRTKYPEINALNEEGCRQALILASLNQNSIDPDEQQELSDRVREIRDRLRRLEYTRRHIDRTTAALKRGRA